ncbi:MAG: thioredoxin domain-containing protein [Streptosporangiales bacterium]|nr:thioredoxin domain-containing protein [Streptosporangiales bacterium]
MSKAARRSARERLREEQRRQAERQRRRRRLLLIVAPIAVIVLVVGAGVAVQALRNRGSEFEGRTPPATLLDNGSIKLAAQGATASTPVIDVYEDFQCPACKEFERINGGRLKELAAERKAVVVYHPVAIIDERSIRSGSAARCAADAGKFIEYHDILYGNQPPEAGGQGFTAEDLKRYGAQAGLKGEKFAQCVESVRYRQEVLQRTQQISTRYQQQTGQGFSTPTVYLNDQPLDSGVLFSADAFDNAVQEATKEEKK